MNPMQDSLSTNFSCGSRTVCGNCFRRNCPMMAPLATVDSDMESSMNTSCASVSFRSSSGRILTSDSLKFKNSASDILEDPPEFMESSFLCQHSLVVVNPSLMDDDDSASEPLQKVAPQEEETLSQTVDSIQLPSSQLTHDERPQELEQESKVEQDTVKEEVEVEEEEEAAATVPITLRDNSCIQKSDARQQTGKSLLLNDSRSIHPSATVSTFSHKNRRRQQIISFIKKSITFFFSHVGLCVAVISYIALGAFLFISLEEKHDIEKMDAFYKSVWDMQTKLMAKIQLREAAVLENLREEMAVTLMKHLQENQRDMREYYKNRTRIHHKHIEGDLEDISERLKFLEQSLNSLCMKIPDIRDKYHGNCTARHDFVSVSQSLYKAKRSVKHMIQEKPHLGVMDQQQALKRDRLLLEIARLPRGMMANKSHHSKKSVNHDSKGEHTDLSLRWSDPVKESDVAFLIDLVHNASLAGWTPDGDYLTGSSNLWSFVKSVQYCITVVTTIGYGKIVTKTDTGRMVTIFYAMIGIPLTLLCLANLGSCFADVFRFSYHHSCLKLYHQRRRLSRFSRRLTKTLGHYSSWNRGWRRFTPENHIVSSMLEAANVTEVIANQAVLMQLRPRRNSTVMQQNTSELQVHVDYASPSTRLPSKEESQPLLSQTPHRYEQAPRHQYPARARVLRRTNSLPTRVERGKKAEKRSASFSTQKYMHTRQCHNMNKLVTIPIWLTVLVFYAYILLGAVVFMIWEDWTFLEATYFCFITLSTIGFGDFVPVSDDNAWKNASKVVFCCFYLLFGLAMIAMCFQLMQEEVKNKLINLGRKIGLLED